MSVVSLRIIAGAFLIVMAAALAGFVRRTKRVASDAGDRDLLVHLVGTDLHSIPWKRLAIVGAAVTALSLALIDPGLASPDPDRRGPVVLLLDASGSMLVEDVGVRRLDLQREIARSLVTQLPDVPIGIVAFSGRAFSLTPPTRDGGALEMYLASIDPTIVTQSGSGLGAAVRQGIALIGAGRPAGGGTIVLFGDGDDTEDREAALAAASLAARNGVRLHTVAIGTRTGGPVPSVELTTGLVDGYLRGPSGEPLVSRVDEDLLRTLSRRAAGIHIAAGEAGSVERLAREIRGGARRSATAADGFPLWLWPVSAAFLLLLLEPLSIRPGRRS